MIFTWNGKMYLLLKNRKENEYRWGYNISKEILSLWYPIKIFNWIFKPCRQYHSHLIKLRNKYFDEPNMKYSVTDSKGHIEEVKENNRWAHHSFTFGQIGINEGFHCDNFFFLLSTFKSLYFVNFNTINTGPPNIVSNSEYHYDYLHHYYHHYHKLQPDALSSSNQKSWECNLFCHTYI